MVNQIDKIVKTLLLLITLIVFNSASAKTKSQVGVIKNSGAAVYKKRSFDAPILAYLNEGQKFRISRKAYTGIGGFGLFYKIRLKKGLIGYIADTDVAPQFTKREGGLGLKANPEFEDVKKRQKPPMVPIFLSRYIGAVAGSINYVDEIAGKDETEYLPMYGLKLSGPGALIEDIPLDFEFLFSLNPPSFYKRFTDTEPSGNVLMTNLGLNFPFIDSESFQVYYTMGFTFLYSSFKLQTASPAQNYDSQEARLGIFASGGLAFRPFKFLILKAEAKYFYEDKQYIGLLGGLQFNF